MDHVIGEEFELEELNVHDFFFSIFLFKNGREKKNIALVVLLFALHWLYCWRAI